MLFVFLTRGVHKIGISQTGIYGHTGFFSFCGLTGTLWWSTISSDLKVPRFHLLFFSQSSIFSEQMADGHLLWCRHCAKFNAERMVFANGRHGRNPQNRCRNPMLKRRIRTHASVERQRNEQHCFASARRPDYLLLSKLSVQMLCKEDLTVSMRNLWVKMLKTQ